MRKILWRILGERKYKIVTHKYFLFIESKLPKNRKISYSQMGEDLILENLLQDRKNGFFVDVGAFHPLEYSNTYFFYRKGWKGINIDATPGSMKLFKLLRPNDMNLEIGIADRECEMPYYLYALKALNTFTENVLQYADKTFNLKPEKIIKVIFFPLSNILDQYLPSGLSIDFMTIDVEGADEIVLRSNNWEKYKPKVICVENHSNYDEFKETSLYTYLRSLNYQFAAKTGPSYFFYLTS